ncbi:hypothetical protein TNCV_4537091 [Trichonephila clavipes]|nr:hypothetical protein TNCV_4537091 [Trichonephila clavipes]
MIIRCIHSHLTAEQLSSPATSKAPPRRQSRFKVLTLEGCGASERDLHYLVQISVTHPGVASKSLILV